MDAIADWVWFVGGGGVAIIALALLYWSLLHDRPRGRRRCPKCWYDMSGSPPPGLTCSECGFTAKREKKLFKTRRRWRWATLALLILTIGAAMLATPTVMRNGWTTYLPTAVLVWLAPTLEDHPTSALATELTERVGRYELRPWHWRTLMRQVEKRDDLAWPLDVHVPERWLVGLPFEVEVTPAARGPFWAQGAWSFCASIIGDDHGHVRVSAKPFEHAPWARENPRWEGHDDTADYREWTRMYFRQMAQQRGSTVWLLDYARFDVEAHTPGTHEIVFNVELYSRLGQFWVRVPGSVEPGDLLWSGKIRKSIRFAERVEDLMTPVLDDELAAKMAAAVQVVPVGANLRVYRLLRPEDHTLAIGGEAELHRNGVLYGRSRLWADRTGEVHTVEGGFGSFSTLYDNEQWARESTWTLRFRSGPEVIYDAEATHYWEGEFEVELAPHARWHHWLYPVVESNDGDAQ